MNFIIVLQSLLAASGGFLVSGAKAMLLLRHFAVN